MKYVLSKSGRKMLVPKNEFVIRLDSNRKCINDIKIINQWLIDQCIEECHYNNDEFNLIGFQMERVGNLPDGSIDAMNMYLFDEIYPKLEILEE